MPHNPPLWQRGTVDQLVYDGPCELLGFLLTDDTSGTCDVTLFDGRDAGGRRFQLLRKQNTFPSYFWPFKDVRFDQGLFVQVGSNVSEWVAIYRPTLEDRETPGRPEA